MGRKDREIFGEEIQSDKFGTVYESVNSSNDM